MESAVDSGLDYWSTVLPDELKLKIVQHLNQLSDLIALMGVSRRTRELILAAQLEPVTHIDDSTLARNCCRLKPVQLVQLLNLEFVADRVESVSLPFWSSIPNKLPDLQLPLKKLAKLVCSDCEPSLLGRFSKVSPHVQSMQIEYSCTYYRRCSQTVSRQCVEWMESLPLTDLSLSGFFADFDAMLNSASLQRVSLHRIRIQQRSLLQLRNKVGQSLKLENLHVIEPKEPMGEVSEFEPRYPFLGVKSCRLCTLELLCTRNVTHLHLYHIVNCEDAELARLFEEAPFHPRRLGLAGGSEINAALRVVCRRFIELEELALDVCEFGGLNMARLERLRSLAICSLRLDATVVDRIAASSPPSLCFLHLVSFVWDTGTEEIETACDRFNGRLPQVAIKLRRYYPSKDLIYNPRHWCVRGKMRSFCCEPCNVAWKPLGCCFKAMVPGVESDHDSNTNAENESEMNDQ